jgi:hypothetical protein
MAATLIRAGWAHFIFNLLLQVFDGVVTYQVISQGVPEANPLVRNLIMQWGLVWGLLYWKTLACLLLVVIFALRHRRQLLTIKAFTVTESVYSLVSFLGLYALFLEFSG